MKTPGKRLLIVAFDKSVKGKASELRNIKKELVALLKVNVIFLR